MEICNLKRTIYKFKKFKFIFCNLKMVLLDNCTCRDSNDQLFPPFVFNVMFDFAFVYLALRIHFTACKSVHKSLLEIESERLWLLCVYVCVCERERKRESEEENWEKKRKREEGESPLAEFGQEIAAKKLSFFLRCVPPFIKGFDKMRLGWGKVVKG